MLVLHAVTRRQRARGLARRDPPPPGVGLLIPRCRSVHTLGMRFRLDLIWLDAGGRPLRIDRGVPGRRLRTCLRARSVLECVAGEAGLFLAAEPWRVPELPEL